MEIIKSIYWNTISKFLALGGTLAFGTISLLENIKEKALNLKTTLLKDKEVPMLNIAKESEQITIQNKEETYMYETPLKLNL